MPVRAFRMKIRPGMVPEYKRRQSACWPNLASTLEQAGVYDYAIFLDEENLTLFAVLKLWHDHKYETLADHPVMKRWWKYMADLMEVEPDNRPREWPMDMTFHLA